MANATTRIRAVFFLSLSISALSCNNRDSTRIPTEEDVTAVGEHLVRVVALSGRDSPDPLSPVVHVGPGLTRKLKQLGPRLERGYRIEPMHEDIDAPLGDGTASHHLFIGTDSGANKKALLGIRLRYDGKLDQFHILGYWTP